MARRDAAMMASDVRQRVDLFARPDDRRVAQVDK
jgi:hypothetical protein